MPRIEGARPIWIHAVSAGETIAAVPLIERLLALGHAVVVSNMTPTGKQQVERLLGDRVTQVYVPYDLPDGIGRFLKRINPKALIVIDTELWPNMVHQCAARKILTLLVNGRLSEKSARGYARVGGLSRPMLNGFTKICVQTQSQAERFLNLGLEPDRLIVTGSIKFDAKFPADLTQGRDNLRARFAGRSIFLAASTHEGEEVCMLEALASNPGPSNSGDLLILVPRHTHRAQAVVDKALSMGYKVVKHSVAEQGPADVDIDVYVVDTMGELIYFYAAADLAFVGGSMVDVGGHNPMEPASLGIPVIMGQYRRNIDDITSEFIAAGAMQVVNDRDGLKQCWFDLMQDRPRRASMAKAGLAVIKANQGALKRIESIITGLLD